MNPIHFGASTIVPALTLPRAVSNELEKLVKDEPNTTLEHYDPGSTFEYTPMDGAFIGIITPDDKDGQRVDVKLREFLEKQNVPYIQIKESLSSPELKELIRERSNDQIGLLKHVASMLDQLLFNSPLPRTFYNQNRNLFNPPPLARDIVQEMNRFFRVIFGQLKGFTPIEPAPNEAIAGLPEDQN